MYPVKSTRMFFGTNTERTASGLSSFLPGDEFYETDTGNTYQHNGTGWTQKNTGGSPGGSDTQVQYNNSGAFGGDAGFTYDPTTDILELTTTTATGGHVSLVNETAASFANIYQVKSTLVNASSSQVVYSQITFGNNGNTAAAENGTIEFDTLVGGTMRSRLYFLDTKTVFNDEAQDIDFIIKGTGGAGAGTDGIFKIDAGSGAVLFSYTTPGDMFNFSSAGIIFNDGEADIDLRIAGNGVTYAYFYDAGNNRHGFGTGTPAFDMDVKGLAAFEVSSSTLTGINRFHNPDTTDNNGLVLNFDTTTTGTGATTQQQVAQIAVQFTTHDHATRSANILFRPTIGGALQNPALGIGNGIVVGSPSGGYPGAGAMSLDAHINLDEMSSTPSSPTAGTMCNIYMKADKLIIQYNQGGTVRYKYLDLTGTGTTWTHTTTPP